MNQPDQDWSAAPLAELTAHIVATHHVYCRQEMPRLQARFAAAAVEGDARYPALANLRTSFDRLSQALLAHLMKEETVLFPLIERIEAAAQGHAPPPVSSFGSVGNPIRMMVLEHSEAEAVLAQMRAATGGWAPPQGAGPRMLELCSALEAFDRDMTRHVDLEDNYLFPRAVAAEREALGH